MTTAATLINQMQCLVRQVRYCPSGVECDRCQGDAGYYSTAGRTAIDLDLARPVLLQVKVSVHYCDRCRHYMRAQAPFLRPDGIYANEVVRKAVNCVYKDGMAMRYTTTRLARDFWVQPSEAIIRFSCKPPMLRISFVQCLRHFEEDLMLEHAQNSFPGVLQKANFSGHQPPPEAGYSRRALLTWPKHVLATAIAGSIYFLKREG